MIYVHFNDLDEFLTELETEATGAASIDARDETREETIARLEAVMGPRGVERGIVRYTSRMHDTGIPGLIVQRISFVAGFIAGDGRLVQIEAPCGAYPMNGPGFEEKHAQVIDRAHALESSLLTTLERLGLEGRNGAFRIPE